MAKRKPKAQRAINEKENAMTEEVSVDVVYTDANPHGEVVNAVAETQNQTVESVQETTEATSATTAEEKEIVEAPTDVATPVDTSEPTPEVVPEVPETFTDVSQTTETIDTSVDAGTAPADTVVSAPEGTHEDVVEEVSLSEPEKVTEAPLEVSEGPAVVVSDPVVTPVQESVASTVKSVYTVDLTTTIPTQADVVATLTESAFTTPIDVTAALPQSRQEAVSQSDVAIDQAVAGADTNVSATLENLRSFVNEMDPCKLISDTTAANKHVGLYRTLVAGIENVEYNFNVFFGTILSVVHTHRETVFHDKHLLRGFASANFRGKEAGRYVNLLTIFKALANPETRAQQVRQINFTKALEGLSERAQQKVRNFFNV